MEAILFDLDGTLIDSTNGIIESFNVAFDTCNSKRADKDDICSLIGYPLEIMFERLGTPKEKIDEHISHYKDHYRKISIATTKLLPQAKDAIELASTLAPLGVVTTKTGKYSKEILENFGVLKYFDAVIGRQDVEKPKPDAEPILKALSLLHVKPSLDVFMIGDTCLDMNAAKNAKINSIALLCGYGDKEDLSKCSQNISLNAFEAILSLKNKCVAN